MEINLCIWCQDADYASHLTYYLLNNSEIHFSMIQISHIEEVREHMLSQVHKKDAHTLWLIDEVYKVDVNRLSIEHPRVMWLTEAWQTSDVSETNLIFPYQRGDYIEKLLVMYFLSQQTGHFRMGMSVQEGQIIGISALNDTLCSTRFGREWGHYLVEQGKKVLWLSLTQFPIYQRFFSGECLYSMEDLIMHLVQGKDIVGLINVFRIKDPTSGMYFLKPHRIFDDLSLVSSQAWITSINQLREIENYDYILIELPQTLDNHTITILSGCDKWITVTEDDDISAYMQQKLTEYLEQTQQQDLIALRKIVHLQAQPKHSLGIYNENWKEVLVQDASRSNRY